jgi:hypothetical protein
MSVNGGLPPRAGRSRISVIDRRGEAMATVVDEMVRAHDAADAADIARLRALSVHERSVLIELACESAAQINRSRLAAGLPGVEPAPWPPSTWEFLRKHAARVRA